MDETTLRFNDWRGHMLSANNVSKVTIRDLHLTRSSPGATQGFVRQVTAGMVVLEIPPGGLTADTIADNWTLDVLLHISIIFLQVSLILHKSTMVTRTKARERIYESSPISAVLKWSLTGTPKFGG